MLLNRCFTTVKLDPQKVSIGLDLSHRPWFTNPCPTLLQMTKKIARFSSFPHLPGILERIIKRAWVITRGAQKALGPTSELELWKMNCRQQKGEALLLAGSLRRGWPTRTGDGFVTAPLCSRLQALQPEVTDGTIFRWLLRCPRKMQGLALARSLREQKNTSIILVISHLLPRAPFYPSLPCSLLHSHWPLIDGVTQAAWSSGFWLVVDRGKHAQEMRGREDVIRALLSHHRPVGCCSSGSGCIHLQVKLPRWPSTPTSPVPSNATAWLHSPGWFPMPQPSVNSPLNFSSGFCCCHGPNYSILSGKETTFQASNYSKINFWIVFNKEKWWDI